jgi:hypothetical protein
MPAGPFAKREGEAMTAPHAEQSETAARVCSELRETMPVGGLFHSTC